MGVEATSDLISSNCSKQDQPQPRLCPARSSNPPRREVPPLLWAAPSSQVFESPRLDYALLRRGPPVQPWPHFKAPFLAHPRPKGALQPGHSPAPPRLHCRPLHARAPGGGSPGPLTPPRPGPARPSSAFCQRDLSAEPVISPHTPARLREGGRAPSPATDGARRGGGPSTPSPGHNMEPEKEAEARRREEAPVPAPSRRPCRTKRRARPSPGGAPHFLVAAAAAPGPGEGDGHFIRACSGTGSQSLAGARHKPPVRPWLAPSASRLFGWTENGCEGTSPSAEPRFPQPACPPSAPPPAGSGSSRRATSPPAASRLIPRASRPGAARSLLRPVRGHLGTAAPRRARLLRS